MYSGRLPIKAAIYAKAIGSLVGMTVGTVRKKMGFRSPVAVSCPHYVFVGGEEMVRCCEQLAADNALFGNELCGRRRRPAVCSFRPA